MFQGGNNMTLPSDYMLHEFRTRENDYLYCGRSNQILRINPVMLDIIPLYGRCSLADVQQRLGGAFAPEDIAHSYSIIDRLAQERGFFQPGGLRHRTFPVSEDRIRTELDQNIQQICLEVTEGCNLRCHYCAYSGGYEHHRQHGARSMSPSVAQAAIDFFFKKNQECQEHFTLSFYGGEPLTQLSLIRSCIQYAHSLPWRCPKALSFSLTTNGTLLTQDTIRFLVDNQVHVLVSLDGPAQDHDAHRVFANGGGTFSKVMENLQRFNEIAPGYPSLSINCVITPTSDVLRLNDFFVQHQDKFRRMTVGDVTPGHQTFFREYPGDPDRQREQFGTLYQQYVEAHLQPGLPVPERPDMFLIRPLHEREFLMLHRRSILAQAPTEFDVHSACFPGKRKVFVDVEGKLHICERITHTCSIGDVWTGYSPQAIKQLLDEFVALLNREECLNCWAFRFCPACFESMADNGHLSLERTQAFCTGVRRSLSQTLRTYCAIIEQNPQAFDYMKEYSME
jgi:uncharacterized protein